MSDRSLISRHIRSTYGECSTSCNVVSPTFCLAPSGSLPPLLSASLCRQIVPESRCLTLAGLAELDLTGCGQLGALPRDVGALARLTRLDCDGCARLPALPPSVTRLSRLRVLNLRGCTALAALPADLLEALAGAPYGSAHRHGGAEGAAAAAAGCRIRNRVLPDPALPPGAPGRNDSAALGRAGGISDPGAAFAPPIRQASSFDGISSIDDDVVIMDETGLPSAQSRQVDGEPGTGETFVSTDAMAAAAGWDTTHQPTSADGTIAVVTTAAACPPAAEEAPAETVLTGLTQINTNGCAVLERPPAMATAAAVLYCRQLAVRFSPPHAAAARAGESASELAERDQNLLSWLKPHSSPITDACQDILRVGLT